jgi:hypothetical protein
MEAPKKYAWILIGQMAIAFSSLKPGPFANGGDFHAIGSSQQARRISSGAVLSI